MYLSFRPSNTKYSRCSFNTNYYSSKTSKKDLSFIFIVHQNIHSFLYFFLFIIIIFYLFLLIFKVNRNSDIYVSLISHTHQVAAKGWFIAMVSTTVETKNPEAEIKPGLDLLGSIKQKFISVSDYMEPTDTGLESQIFISTSYDATTHFETTCLDVLDIFKRATGEEFDFNKVKQDLGDEDQ